MKKDSRHFTLILAVLASFLITFVGSSVNIALPQIGHDLAITTTILTWIPTSYLLVLAVLIIPLGRLSDIHGRKKIFMIGILIFTVSSFLAGFSSSGAILLFFRFIQAVGSAMIFANVNAIVASVFPVMNRGHALGITISGAFLGLFLGPIIGGILTVNLGWRSIFFINIPIGITTMWVAFKLKEEWNPSLGEIFDIKGTIILGTSTILSILGLTQLPSTNGFYFLISGIIGGFIYYLYQNRVKTPVFDLGIFKNRVFGFNSLAIPISFTATYPIIFLLSLYLQYVLKLNPVAAGLVLSAQPLFLVIFSSYTGKLADKMDPFKLTVFGMSLVGLTSLTLTIFNSKPWEIFIILALMGMGLAFFGTPNNKIIFSAVEKNHLGVAGAYLSTMRVLGQLMGMVFVLLILNLFMGNAIIGPDNLDNFIFCTHISFMVIGILCGVAVLLIWLGKNDR